MHDDEFSVTPLRPADSASPAAQPSAARPPRRFRGLRGRLGRLGAASALALLTLSLCALLLTQLGGVEPLLKLAPLPGRVSPSSDAHVPVPTATADLAHQVFQYPTPLGGTPTPLGPAPASCPADVLRAFNPNDATGGVGHAPVWVGFWLMPAGMRATLHPSGTPAPALRRIFGFPVPLVVETTPGAAERIIITASDAAPGQAALWFAPDPNSGQLGPTPGLIIDPRDTHIPLQADGWKYWFVTLYLPRSGCFDLAAVWATGNWDATVAGGA
jgi:hypothetical protein